MISAFLIPFLLQQLRPDVVLLRDDQRLVWNSGRDALRGPEARPQAVRVLD